MPSRVARKVVLWLVVNAILAVALNPISFARMIGLLPNGVIRIAPCVPTNSINK